MNKLVHTRPYADPEVAARKIVELANAVEPVQDGRIHIEKINGPFLFQPAEYKGWLVMHESGSFVKFTSREHRGRLHGGQAVTMAANASFYGAQRRRSVQKGTANCGKQKVPALIMGKL